MQNESCVWTFSITGRRTWLIRLISNSKDEPQGISVLYMMNKERNFLTSSSRTVGSRPLPASTAIGPRVLGVLRCDSRVKGRPREWKMGQHYAGWCDHGCKLRYQVNWCCVSRKIPFILTEIRQTKGGSYVHRMWLNLQEEGIHVHVNEA